MCTLPCVWYAGTGHLLWYHRDSEHAPDGRRLPAPVQPNQKSSAQPPPYGAGWHPQFTRRCAVPWSEYVTEYVRIFQPAWIKIISEKVKTLWDAGWNTLYLCHLCDSVHLTQRPISQLPFTTLRRCREVWLTKRGREVPGRQFAENIWKLKTLLGWRMDHQWSATSGLHFASPSHAGMCWAKSLTLAINAVFCARLCRLQHHQFYAIGHGEIQVSEPGGDRKN